jgi:hypothetical protein
MSASRRHAAEAADAARAAKVSRNAWLLGGLATFFYLGFIAWTFVRGALGG